MGVTLSLHVALIVLTHRFPKKLLTWHAPIIVLSNFLAFAMSLLSGSSYTSLFSNVLYFTFFVMSGKVLSCSWIYTAVAMIMNLIGGIFMLIFHFRIYDIGCITQLLCITMLAIYSTFHNEKLKKNDFLLIKEI